MCAVIPHNLGKGTRWRVPVASPRRMTRIRHRADRVIRIVSPIHHSQGLELSRSTCHRTLEDRIGRSSATRGSLRAPRDPMVNRPPIECRQRLAAGPRAWRIRSPCAHRPKGVSPPLEPRARLGALSSNAPSHAGLDAFPSRTNCVHPGSNCLYIPQHFVRRWWSCISIARRVVRVGQIAALAPASFESIAVRLG